LQAFHPVGFFSFGRQIILTKQSTLIKSLRPASHEKDLGRNRGLSRAFIEVKAALSERMYAAGIDDGERAAKIIEVDGQLHWAEADGHSAQELKAVCRRLVLQLAAAALENDGPLPGAEVEYGRARETQAALTRNANGVSDRLQAYTK
jgi:hypothetical protein